MPRQGEHPIDLTHYWAATRIYSLGGHSYTDRRGNASRAVVNGSMIHVGIAHRHKVAPTSPGNVAGDRALRVELSYFCGHSVGCG